ncbi:hypothetical protein [Amnibacterium endophyticum]|uniref:PH domain-containing protein n=1 Tax=Amnibacterium endophyticum TaxID=2109337 RepID=A0ABW4LG18_9MICO
MVNPWSVVLAVALVVLALAGMALSWRRRRRGQRGLRLPPGQVTGAERAAAAGTYLATTFAGRPLDRVVAAGLGFRAAARLAVADDGLRIERAGADPIALPAERLTGAGSGSWALDRGADRGGLLVGGGSLDDADGRPVPVESAFRLDAAGQAAVSAALVTLVPTPGGA